MQSCRFSVAGLPASQALARRLGMALLMTVALVQPALAAFLPEEDEAWWQETGVPAKPAKTSPGNEATEHAEKAVAESTADNPKAAEKKPSAGPRQAPELPTFTLDGESFFYRPMDYETFKSIPRLPSREEDILPWDREIYPVQWSGYLKNETAFRFQEPRSYTKIRNIAYLKGFAPTSDRLSFTAVGRYYYDLVYDLFDYDTIAARSERDIDQPLAFVEGLPQEKDSNILELREFYVDITTDNADIRIGKQFVIWGVLTGIRIIDEINPMDFRELILPELLDYRVPLWTLKVDYYTASNTQYEFLWIPDIQFHKPAPRGSEWELFQEVPGTVYPETFTLENSEVGLKVSNTWWNTELQFSYFYTWDDFPVIFRKVLVDQDRVNIPPEFYPRFKRMHMLGMSFTRDVFGQILKGEIAYVKNKYFGLEPVDRDGDGYIDNLGVLPRDHIRFGYGLDFNLWKTDFSPAFSHWYIINYDPAIIQDELDSSFNIFIRKEMPEDQAVFEFLGIYLINLNELYLKPKLSFNATNRLIITLGLDLFYGRKGSVGIEAVGGSPTNLREVTQSTQFIGNFRRNDRAFIEFKYSF